MFEFCFCSVVETWVQSKCFKRSCPCHYNDEASRTGRFFWVSYHQMKTVNFLTAGGRQNTISASLKMVGCRRARTVAEVKCLSGCARRTAEACWPPLWWFPSAPGATRRRDMNEEDASDPEDNRKQINWALWCQLDAVLLLHSQTANTTVTNTNEFESYLQTS